MRSSRFNIHVILFSLSIAFTSSLFMWTIGQENKMVTSVSLVIIWMLEIYFLIRYVNMTNKNLLLFLQSFHYKDHSVVFNKNRKLPFRSLYDEFNRIIDLFDQMKMEKETEHQYFEHVIKHVDTGLLAWDSGGNIKLFNLAAQQLLKLPYISKLDSLKNISRDLPERLSATKPGHQELIKILRGDELISLYVRLSEFTIGGEQIRLASFQNIHPEIEESESEAWRRIIKILTHEIVNSVGPMKLVSSALLKNLKKQKIKTTPHLEADTYENLVSGLNAIYRRSIGLSKFVDDYKTINQIPTPEFHSIRVTDLLENLMPLIREDPRYKEIDFRISVNPSNMEITMDVKMVEQVIINILKNAAQSLVNVTHPVIHILVNRSGDQEQVVIQDNGCGIPFNLLDYIFMPFFTTKKGGSGIGLTLSRQIMKVHKGSIRVISKEREGTKVVLIF